MLTRIRPHRALELARRDLPTPVDVVNLITPSPSFEPYRWYGVLVMPALLAAGARVLWMGRLEDEIAGERQAGKLLVVRYPSHRRFLAMTLNPYYLAINRLREAGVERFEAAFTSAEFADPQLARRRQLLGVHFNSPDGTDALAAITQALSEAGYELAYATRMTAPISFLEPARETDPNPLALAELALFAPPDGAEFTAHLRERIDEVTAEYALHLYARESRSEYRPSLRPVRAEVA